VAGVFIITLLVTHLFFAIKLLKYCKPTICINSALHFGERHVTKLIYEDEAMQFPKTLIFFALSVLLFSGIVWSQEKTEREVTIQNNVKLVILAPASDMPEGIQKQYHAFLPTFEQVLKENTTAQSDECSLTLRITPGLKEIGALKVRRPFVRITAFRRNSREEYATTLLLYSYTSSGPVTKEETSQILKKQVLEPAECNAKTE
jgi:hypothetical protein